MNKLKLLIQKMINCCNYGNNQNSNIPDYFDYKEHILDTVYEITNRAIVTTNINGNFSDVNIKKIYIRNIYESRIEKYVSFEDEKNILNYLLSIRNSQIFEYQLCGSLKSIYKEYKLDIKDIDEILLFIMNLINHLNEHTDFDYKNNISSQSVYLILKLLATTFILFFVENKEKVNNMLNIIFHLVNTNIQSSDQSVS
jgi:hypothetical protein